jgi:primosomal replication protein N''
MSSAPKTISQSENRAGITIESSGTSIQSDSHDFSGLQISGVTSIKRLLLLDSSGKEAKSGEAELFDATWQGRRVVIKWFHYDKKPKSNVMELIAKLDRKCVVDILDTGICSGRAYEILEFIEHGDLNAWQQKYSRALQDPSFKSGLPENKVRQILEELTNAVESLHQFDIIHRDIKPANILVRSEDPLDLVLADFGISSLTDLSLHQTSRDRTAAYSAPEAMTGIVTKASDWWSVGAVVLKLLTGRDPFDGVGLNAIDFILVKNGLEIPPELPERWKILLSGLLCQDCSHRWGTDQARDWLAGKELMPPLGSRLGFIGVEGELQTAVPYTFKNEKFFAAAPLAHALARNWKEGLKHYGRGLIFRWLDNDLKDAEKVVQISEFAENAKLTAEMKFALALNVLDPKLQLSWRGEVINAAFAHSNGETLWSMVEADMLKYSGGHEVLSMAEVRRNAYLDII